MRVRSPYSQRRTSGCCLRLHLDYSFLYLLIIVCIFAICPVTKCDSEIQEYICSNIDIRNSVAHFSKLQNCTVIEGYLQILLIDKGTDQDYTNLSFPKLREITGYLLLYRAFGLPSLRDLFPNLAVIRGEALFHNYALVAFEMSQLQEIGLRSLTDILRGSVRIEKNPNLCYIDSIDWDYIAKAGAGGHFFKDNKLQKDCPDTCPASSNCPVNTKAEKPSHLCWNSRSCQKKCLPECERQNQTCMTNQLGECCHSECLAGCVGKGANECISCRHVVYKGRCMKRCPPNTYIYKGWRCVREDECRSMPNTSTNKPESNTAIYWKPFDGICLPDCPSGFMENSSDKHSCVQCQNHCPKVCASLVVDNVAAAQGLHGCTIIDGSLEIRIQGGTNIIDELEKNLKDIQEIKGYLKIARSYPLVSLNFLKGLTHIGGKPLHQNDYAFVVLENQNLKDLWDIEYRKSLPRLNITSGKIFFHFNSKLCLSKINDMKKYADLLSWEDRDVSPSSNGDRIACDLTSMNVKITKRAYNSAVISWSNIKSNLTDPRSLLGYVIYYREAPTKNISLFDGHDACGSNVWKVDDVEVGNDTIEQHLLTNLQPYTQYAAYVRTYTTASAQTGAQSHTIYFTTEPDTPTLPVGVKAHSTTHSEIVISWKPPKRQNGNITHYVIEGKKVVESSAFINQRNYCDEPITYSDLKKKIAEEVETNTPHIWLPNSTSDDQVNGKKCCSCSTGQTSFSVDGDEDAEFQIHFEDFLHNTVYVKNPKHQSSKNRSRRTSFTTGGPSLVPNHIPSTLHKLENITSVSPTFVSPTINVSEMFTEIVHHNNFLVVSQLHHFTEYTIKVIACQDKFKSNSEPRSESRRPPCSSKAITTVRTLKLGGADDINSSTIYIRRDNASSGSIYIKWEEPKDPNGLIVSYQIEYKKTNVENIKATKHCITQLEYQQYNGYIITNLDPGNYSIRLQATSLAGKGNWTFPVYTDIPEIKDGLSATIVGTIVAVVTVFILSLFSVCGWVYYKKRYAADLPGGILYTSVNPEYMSAGYVYEPDEWEVPREKISLIRELGQGSFGMVYEGEAKDLEPGKPLIKCAVKTVADNSTVREKIEFLQEASVMKAFSCHHVVKLLGVVAKGHPPLVVMELMANGDLKSYLRFHRPDAEKPINRQPPTLKRIFQMAVEIADGMAYLAAKKFVHRDLAARNCMVAEDLTVKIGDFGMTRDIYETDYYRKGGKGLLPVRWMAPESLKDGVFTSQSDVWSYGIVLWEMATLASQPYQGLSNEQVLKYVINGNIMEKPENCPDRLYALMKLCWARNPKARPTFTELIEILLPDVNQYFREVSFYFTQRQHVGPQQVDIDPPEEATPSTPFKSRSTWDDRSVCSHDNSDEETDIQFFPSVTFVQEESNKSPHQCPAEKQCIDKGEYHETYGSEEGSKGLSIHSNEESRGMSLPSSDDSKGSKVSNLSNGSLVNGHIPYPAGRTTMC